MVKVWVHVDIRMGDSTSVTQKLMMSSNSSCLEVVGVEDDIVHLLLMQLFIEENLVFLCIFPHIHAVDVIIEFALLQ